jgi:hypothetical protein
MSDVPTNDDKRPADMSPALIVMATIGDTTWRMFIPVFGGAIIGYGIDSVAASRPVGVLAGTFIGVIGAIVLVYAQYNAATSNKGDS